MVKIQAKSIKTIQLGHRGENEARQIIFDLADYISTYGPGTARLLHQRPGDPAPYIVPAVQDGDTLTWTVTDEDTAAPGTGSAELQWMVNNVLAKSDIWCTKTKAALDDGATAPPTGAEGWYQQLIAYIDSLRGEGISAEQIAAAVEAYLADNPVSVPVDSVNGKTGAVQLTAEDVGALAQDDLQAGVDAALEQAKASGEFDGPTGEDGGYYTPSVDADGNLNWASSKADMPAVSAANIKGPSGTTGKSAYQYAQDGGYHGTEAEFAAKLAEELPDKLPNPNALTFTGAVTGSYDGSAPLSVEIPSGGSGGSSGGGESEFPNWRLIKTISFSADIGSVTFDTDDDGNTFSLKEIMLAGSVPEYSGYIYMKPASSGRQNSIWPTAAKGLRWWAASVNGKLKTMLAVSNASVIWPVDKDTVCENDTISKLVIGASNGFKADGTMYVYGR